MLKENNIDRSLAPTKISTQNSTKTRRTKRRNRHSKKTEKTIAADDSENSSNEIEDSNPRPVVIVPLDDIANTGKFSLV